MRNITLIGMPGAGKSTIGVVLAKVLGYNFVDTDLIIQDRERRLLKDIIREEGMDGFLSIENTINSTIETTNSVISPGGSVIYGENAMRHLREISVVVYIKLSYETICNRLGNIRKRGVVLRDGQSLMDLYYERCPLYEKHAHIIVDGEDMDIEEVMENIKNSLDEYQES